VLDAAGTGVLVEAGTGVLVAEVLEELLLLLVLVVGLAVAAEPLDELLDAALITSADGGAGVATSTGGGVASTTMICPNVGLEGTVVKVSGPTGGIETSGSGVGMAPGPCNAGVCLRIAKTVKLGTRAALVASRFATLVAVPATAELVATAAVAVP
jgi:hypothetical protein